MSISYYNLFAYPWQNVPLVNIIDMNFSSQTRNQPCTSGEYTAVNFYISITKFFKYVGRSARTDILSTNKRLILGRNDELRYDSPKKGTEMIS